MSTPSSLRAIPSSELSVIVSIQGDSTVYAGVVDASGNWAVQLNVELGKNYMAVVSWYYNSGGAEPLLIATQTGNFFTSPLGRGQLSGSLETSGTVVAALDIDCDGVSNLDEINSGSNPTDGSCDASIDAAPVTTNQTETDTGIDTETIPVPETIAIPTDRCFDMGSAATEDGRNAEWEVQHQVCIANAISFGVYEVTYDQYYYFANQPENREVLPYKSEDASGNTPVVNIDWQEATSYASWLSRVTGKNYRLPTEAEWEYAARAGTTTSFWTGEILPSSFENISSGEIIEVGSLNMPNPWGLHDMLGNVSEWTCSSFNVSYGGDEEVCDANPLVNKVLRGGRFWYDSASSRSARRHDAVPTEADGGYGFRVVLVE